MATYTDNYQLTKPTYAEQADIGVINSNMNKIDEIMHSSQISLAPAYDQSQTYAEGDVVMYELLMYKCISPTTGAWDASKWERTTASESGGGGSAELDILGEGSGAVVSFSDGASAELAKCIVEIVPKQDLHGYDKPWAGGAGNNILRINSNLATKTINGGTLTPVYDDGGNLEYLNLDGTISENTDFVIGGTWGSTTPFITLPAGAYTMSKGINTNTIQLCARYGSNDVFKAYASSYNFTLNNDETIGCWFLRCNTGTYDNIKIYPQVESRSTATTYKPYSNICPISGSTSVTVTVSDGETSTTKITPLGQTVYGGQLNVLTGLLTITNGYIASYNGETLLSTWISDRDEYAPNTSPTTGAQVVYTLTAPQTVQLTPQEVNSLLGQNNISADTGDVDIVYVKASAPIQPNPTGTPTATLKKLGIEGTVFEVEGGGGGSSSGINYSTTEKVIGTAEDENGIIKPLYEKMTYISSLPNATESEYSLGIINIRKVYYIKCIAETSTIALPLFYNAGNDNQSKIQMFVSDKLSGKIKINTFGDNRSGMSGTVIIRYTKTTD